MAKAVALGLALVMTTSVTLAASRAPRADLVPRGEALVTRDCSGCHAVGRSGASPNPQAPPFRRLHERYEVDALGEALAEGLTVGHGPMPEWTFPPADVSAILAYLKSLQPPDAAKSPATPERAN